MDILLSNSSGQPLYAQIVSQVRQQILSGELAGDTPLPSMRQLAAELRTSVITTKRAYEELEREGLIYSHTGRGSFVRKVDIGSRQRAQQKEVEAILGKAAEAARQAGLSEQDFLQLAATQFRRDL